MHHQTMYSRERQNEVERERYTNEKLRTNFEEKQTLFKLKCAKICLLELGYKADAEKTNKFPPYTSNSNS